MKSVLISIQPKWKDIEGYEGEYQINHLGEIRTLKNSSKLKKFDILKPQLSKRNGYMYQMLYKNGKPKLVRIHRIVAKAYVPNLKKFTQVNHIDGNKQNNNASNLEWCDQHHNMKHAYDTGLQKPSEKQKDAIRNINKLKRKKVMQLKDGKAINVFSSISEASMITNTTVSSISRCCNLKRISANGYEWRFI